VKALDILKRVLRFVARRKFLAGATLICGLFLMYLLSLGPAYAAARYGVFQSAPTAFARYWQPANVISKMPILRSAMEGYIDFWLIVTDAPDTTL
jgi:hypothetical protein